MRSTPALLPGATFDPQLLLAPHAALAAFGRAVTLALPAVETVGLAAAFGRVLAVDAVAREDFPNCARSTMDGFAVRSLDGREARQIVAEIRMGQAPPAALGRGEAMQIPTGGMLPSGADAVVPIEDTETDGETLRVRTQPAPDDCLTAAGADMRPGDRAIGAGRRIGGPEMGVLATLGAVNVAVYRRPRFAIISTGDELVAAAQTPLPGQIRDSNRWAIAGALAAMGADAVHVPNAPDDLEALQAALRAGLDDADGVFLTGGSSVGARDLTPDAIARFPGPGVIVHGLRVKPGKPTVLAAVGAQPVIGLPGNPASALMILEAVCAPIVRTMTGEAPGRNPAAVRAKAGGAFAGRPGWTWFVPAELRASQAGDEAFPLALRSAHTSLLTRASGYVVLSAERSHVEAGEFVDVLRFSAGGRL